MFDPIQKNGRLSQKKIGLYALGLVVTSLLGISCSGPNPHFIKKPGEIRLQIKRIVVLPVYFDPEFFPQLPEQLKDLRYDPAFQASVTKAAQSKLPAINEAVKEILATGTYRFEVVEANLSDLKALKTVKKRTDFYNEKGIISKPYFVWPFNRHNYLMPETIRQIAQKYDADAVFFHDLLVNKRWHSAYWSEGRMQYSIIMPFDGIIYSPNLYAANGELLYGGARKDHVNYRGQKHVENVNGANLTFIQRATANEQKTGYKTIAEDLPVILSTIEKWTSKDLKERFTFSKYGPLSGLYEE